MELSILVSMRGREEVQNTTTRGEELQSNTCMYMCNTVEPEIFARRKFSPISSPGLAGENFVLRIFCPVLMSTQSIIMVTFTIIYW